ncbi:tetratricopeptide repeat protein [Ichthyobacterium seriolicida]|uniref:PEP-CTERM system TPR-repeat lipoprotein n=1 Tax=Ichthyobacterium seriolicida TaxID=242600 RepID=A0A1J1E4T3_9FLAO|nr:hypothetical protein [Ichthyobacterium seriolicida]BAV94326.1 PEP-CTERM system TPR-repeat lipoprotein [Ichthyobacterium seriolicida]
MKSLKTLSIILFLIGCGSQVSLQGVIDSEKDLKSPSGKDSAELKLSKAKEKIDAYLVKLRSPEGVKESEKIEDESMQRYYYNRAKLESLNKNWREALNNYKSLLEYEKGNNYSAKKSISGEMFFFENKEALDRAIESGNYTTPKVLEVKDLLSEKVNSADAMDMYLEIRQEAVKTYDEKKFKISRDNFIVAYETSAMVNKADTSMYYNAAISALSGELSDLAIKDYEHLYNIGYRGDKMLYEAIVNGEKVVFESKIDRDVQVRLKAAEDPRDYRAPDLRKGIILQLAVLYEKQESYDKALKLLDKGREEYAEDQELLLAKGNIYLKKGDESAFLESMKDAVKNDPKNAVLHFNMGVIYANLLRNKESEREKVETSISAKKNEITKYRKSQRAKREKAEKELLGLRGDLLAISESTGGFWNSAIDSYKESITLDDKFLDAYINLSALILSSERSINDQISNLGFSAKDKARYEDLKKRKNEIYKQAMGYLEKALSIDGKNKSVINTLKNIYYALEKHEKVKEMEKLSK